MAKRLEELTRSDIVKEVKGQKSYEYKIFVKEKVERTSWYEKACRWAGSLIKLPLSKKEKEELAKDIVAANINVKPSEVMSFSIIVLLGTMMVSMGVILLSGSIWSFALLPVSFYTYVYFKNYPNQLAKKRVLEETSEMVLGVLYIVVFMRHTPNLVSAIRFAADNLQGHLSKDFKLLVWGVQTKRYKDIYEALDGFLSKWIKINKPFVDAMNLVISSVHQIDESKRKSTLDMAVDTMLTGTYETMVRYANKLKTPVQAVSLMGITLPILTLVMLPMVSAFLSDLITTKMIFIFYDIILPIVVLFFIRKVLGQRPVGFSLPDVSNHPDVPPKNKFYLTIRKGKRSAISVFILPSIVLIASIIIFLMYVYSVQGLPPSKNDLFGSLTIVIGLAASAVLYFYLDTFQRIKVREKIGSVESEFTNAAYIISNLLSDGKPLETALFMTSKELKNSTIHNFFEKIETNMKQLGMDVERAIFDDKEGAINLYPSILVKSIMRILVSTSKESSEAASISMNNIGRYTKSIHRINEKINDILSDTISSIGFQANFIAPLITGVVVGLSVMIFLILNNLSAQVGGLSSQGGGVATGGMNIDFLMGFLNMSSSIPIWGFQPIVGVYLIEVLLLMVYLINMIQYAGDSIYFKSKAAKTLFISTTTYVIVVSITTLLFTGIADMAIRVGV